jgi:hypothetical protein
MPQKHVGPQPRPKKQAVNVGDRVLASTRNYDVTAAVVVAVEWKPRPRKPISWERDRQWQVIVQFPDGRQRRGSWDLDWVTPQDGDHFVRPWSEMDLDRRERYYAMWDGIEADIEAGELNAGH